MANDLLENKNEWKTQISDWKIEWLTNGVSNDVQDINCNDTLNRAIYTGWNKLNSPDFPTHVYFSEESDDYVCCPISPDLKDWKVEYKGTIYTFFSEEREYSDVKYRTTAAVDDKGNKYNLGSYFRTPSTACYLEKIKETQ